jgi:type VI secretion system protein ImpH
MPDLIATLIERPQDFDLFQALHLLERSEPDRPPVGTSLGLDEAVRLVGQVSLGFPPSDVHTIAPSDRPGPRLTLSSPVMALGGGQGPLPVAFTEMLLEAGRQRNPAGLAFLDIFHQRFLGFLYRGRSKHRVALSTGPLAQAPALRVLDAVSGLGRGEGARAPGGQQAWLRHAGLQGAAPRSMASLLALLRDRLGIPVTGQAFAGAWHALAPQDRARLAGRGAPAGAAGTALGGTCTTGTALGGTCALGARIWNPLAGIALSTPALDAARFQALLPGGRLHSLLGWLVARHQQMDTRVELQVSLADAVPTRLGVSPAAAAGCLPRLGLSAWLGGGAVRGEPARMQGPRFLLSSQGATHGH